MKTRYLISGWLFAVTVALAGSPVALARDDARTVLIAKTVSASALSGRTPERDVHLKPLLEKAKAQLKSACIQQGGDLPLLVDALDRFEVLDVKWNVIENYANSPFHLDTFGKGQNLNHWEDRWDLTVKVAMACTLHLYRVTRAEPDSRAATARSSDEATFNPGRGAEVPPGRVSSAI